MLDINKNKSIIFEGGKPFSECALWDLQRDFFLREGVNAWDHQVPFYITSNPSIANSYATMMLRFMQDWRQTQAYESGEPFYILELGAGCGRFGFYALKRLFELQQQLGLDAIRFVYVLTDFVERNLDYWCRHPAWQPYIEQHCVDFAHYDVERDTQLTLRQSGTVLGAGAGARLPESPCLVIANYVFDSLSHDIFRVQDGVLYAAMTCLSTDAVNLEGEQALKLEQVEVDFSYEKITGAYYGIDAFDRLLQGYRHQLNDEHVILPIGALRCLENLKTLCQDRYLMLAADKGDHELFQVARQSAPHVSLHGNCFSMQVNFHALIQYMQHTGGDSYSPPLQPGITSVALLAGVHFSTLPETRQAVDDDLRRFSPATLFNVYAYIRDTVADCPPETFVALMTMTDWDPHIFNKVLGALLDKLPECSDVTLHALKAGMPIVADHFYYMPGTIDTLSGIALFFQELEDYDAALEYYQKSISYYGEADHVCYNMGLCYYYEGDSEQALHQFERSLQLNPELNCARQWLNKITMP